MINENSMGLLRKGYLADGEQSWNDIARRVSNAVAKAEYNEDDYKNWVKEFYEAISELYFIPSTPCLINAGTESNQLSSCFILDVDDNLESIYQTKAEMAKIFQKNGGAGLNLSILRPSNANVIESKGKSCGPIGFMEEFDLTADIITRNNLRKGALKIDLDVWHPDILDFISCKDDTTKLTRMNISVALSDKFMNAIKNNEMWELEFPDFKSNKDLYDREWNGNIELWKNNNYPTITYTRLKARELYRNIMEHAWKTGEPGVSFIDTMDRDNPNPGKGKINSTNPCSEFCSIPYNSCNLGSINLSKFIKDYNIEYDKLNKYVRLAIRFLDNMISVNKLPTPKIQSITQELRSVGLGTMGFADMLYEMEIPYDSEMCLQIIDDLYSHIKHTAENESVDLARSRGEYPAWNNSIWQKQNIKIRNSNLLSIAPNGSISFLANTSGGIEPNFALCYTRRMHDGTLFNIINPVFERILDSLNLDKELIVEKVINNNGSCRGILEVPERIQKVFCVASDISPEYHVKVVGQVQKYVDLSISKTVNMPNSATIEDVSNVYMNAWEQQIKGITIYRDGCREFQTLTVGNNNENIIQSNFDSISPINKDELGETYGVNVKRKVACGNLYLNVCRDKDGNLVEMFVNTGKGGICQSNINAISRLISMSLRSGVKVTEIVDQLKSIICPACTKSSSKGDKLSGLSCPDVIAKFLLKEYNREEIVIKNPHASCIEECSIEVQNFNSCPDCGANLIYEGGCVTCKECGWSKCQ